MLRLGEYSPVLDAQRFAAHEKFFVQDVRQRARSRSGAALPAERTAVCGVSASAELALAMGQGHPGIYGAVFCASPGGGYRPPAVMPSSLPRVYLVAGRRSWSSHRTAPERRQPATTLPPAQKRRKNRTATPATVQAAASKSSKLDTPDDDFT